MKRYSTTLFFALLAIGTMTLFSSCGKGDDDDTGGSGNKPKSNSVTATVGGKPLNTATILAVYESSNGVLNVTANGSDQATVVGLYIDLNEGLSQAISSGGPAYASVQTSASAEGTYEGVTGNITMTTNDKNAGIVEGTFSFQGRNANNESIEVENGTFYVKYDK